METRCRHCGFQKSWTLALTLPFQGNSSLGLRDGEAGEFWPGNADWQMEWQGPLQRDLQRRTCSDQSG